LMGVGASCAGYALGTVCSFGDEPSYDCTCTKMGSGQTWDCVLGGPGSSSSSGTGGGACHGDMGAWATITAGPLTCQKNSDCCVVVNGCLSQAQVVKASDSMTAGAAWPYCDNQCNNCIPPAIQVGCVNGQCVGQDLDMAMPPPPDSLRMDHCGVDTSPVMTPAA